MNNVPFSHDIQLLAFDADDTLWDNQAHFDQAEQDYCKILSPWGTAQEVSAALYDIESNNMPLLGYGCKAFTISLVENAVRMSHGEIAAKDLLKIVELGKRLLTLPATPLPEVPETLEHLRQDSRYKMVVFTKGELLDQENKLVRSGLKHWFDDVVVVSDKTVNEYQKLCQLFDTDISRMVMIGNSFRSDIEPVLQLGGYAVHIPFHTTWKHESVQEHDHPNLRRISHFGQIPELMASPD